MKSWIPWGTRHTDPHFFPNEEYQLSRIGINDATGREEVIHYSHGEFHEGDVYHSFDSYMFGYLPLDYRDYD